MNGTWTKNHIDSLLGPRARRKRGPVNSAASDNESERENDKEDSDQGVDIVYPPCDTVSLQKLTLEGRDPNIILSVAQFRCVMK